MGWRVPNIWEGSDVYILGGGPSLTKQFDIPDSVVESVVNKTSSPNVYSPYMSKLHDKNVIGINIAYMIGNWINMVFFGDIGFFLRNEGGLAEFPGLKITCHDRVRVNWVKYLPADSSKRIGLSENPGTVCWNYNSGAAAISLAAHLGAKRIILLGFDMKESATGINHWHDQYNRIGAVNSKGRPIITPYETHMKGFPWIRKDALRRGIEIINCCPDSAIESFPKCNLKEIL
jgi:hypothetical protein